MTNPKLQRKIKENHERRFREYLIESLPKSLSELVSEGQCIYSDKFLSKYNTNPRPNFENGTLTAKNNFKTYIYFDFDNIIDVERVVNKSIFEIKKSFIFWIGDGPVFLINQSLNKRVLLDLLKCYDKMNWRCLLISNNDFSRGVLIESYCGSLPDNRITNSREIVYEIVYFDKI